jgi:excinuclease ABC subunit A
MQQQEKNIISSKKNIFIKGARVHNLKNISISIPHNKLIVITGLSGSGKSSLAFDTLYAEGQRRYVESLSSYARQFMGKLEKPDVDSISGIAPAIAIEQKVNTHNSRSTVGTSTEIYDYLKILFARIGKTYSPISGNEVVCHKPKDVLNYINFFKSGSKGMLLFKLKTKAGRSIEEELSLLQQQGFSRIKINDELKRIEDIGKVNKKQNDIYILVDRFVVDADNEENIVRISDSIETAFFEANGNCCVEMILENNKTEKKMFSNRFEADGITFEEPSIHFFSFNNPIGACKTCDGFGNVIGVDEDLVVPNKNLSVYEDAIVCWKGEKMQEWKDDLIKNAHQFNFPVHKPYYELKKEQKELLWTGNKYFYGLNKFFKYLEEKSYKIQYRVMLSRYRGRTQCPECRGTRLRNDAAYVKVGSKNIMDIVLMPVSEALIFFNTLKLNKHETLIAKRVIEEITNRLSYLCNVGLEYLTLNRLSSSLSGGESQRINLATSLGSSLVGSMYILDEPSIGLHPRDTQQLLKVLRALKEAGNTVIIVEHDEEIMKAADEIIDMGPMAGTLGGEVVFQGNHNELINADKSITARFLTGKENIPIPENRRSWNRFIELQGCRENNLKNITVKFPLNTLTLITGVSGSGKSSLVKGVLAPALKKLFDGYTEKTGMFDKLSGDINSISSVEFIDQNPIGRSSRSNPVTYVKAFDEIRELFATRPISKMRGYKPSFFSFNIDGGRCETCKGDGNITVEMQFMADIHLVCDECKGKKYKEEILEIFYKNKNIFEILNLTVDDAIDFFSSKIETASTVHKDSLYETKIIEKLMPLKEVGLGYVKLGQPSSTLSGGEAQRIKLASFLSKKTSNSHVLFIFDEPTTGLHFYDIKKLLKAFDSLIKQGHSLIVIEHNVEVIKCADWVIDLGAEGGDKGGNLVFEGTPENLIECKNSYTGKYLREKLK